MAEAWRGEVGEQGREMHRGQRDQEGTSENSTSIENRTKVSGSRKEADSGNLPPSLSLTLTHLNLSSPKPTVCLLHSAAPGGNTHYLLPSCT